MNIFLKTLIEKYPNDADLGAAIRSMKFDNIEPSLENSIKTKEDANRLMKLLMNSNHENRVH